MVHFLPLSCTPYRFGYTVKADDNDLIRWLTDGDDLEDGL